MISPRPNAPLLQVNDLVVQFPGRGKHVTEVLHGVSFDIGVGETVALVGESGSGKTTIGRAILGLTPITSGTIRYDGQLLRDRNTSATGSQDIQVVFQDPYSSLNPSLTIESSLLEPRRVAGLDTPSGLARELLGHVGLPADAASRYPHEFSGGQRQRIAIARALSVEPRLIVCDEPTSALDVSTQARVLDLFQRIRDETGVAYLFISHDLAVVRKVSNRIAVLYRGDIVEIGEAEQVTEHPQNEYTQRLQLSTPVPDPIAQRARRERRRELLRAEGLADRSGLVGIEA